MLIIFSVIILIAFIIISLYEKDYNKDKLISKLTVWIKTIILIPVFGILLFKSIIYFFPSFLSAGNSLFPVYTKQFHFTENTQEIIIKNDLNFEQSYYIYNQLKNEKWEIQKPINQFDFTYKSYYGINTATKLIINADTSLYRKLCLIKINDSLPNETFVYRIPSNTIIHYSSEKGTNENIENISYIKNIKNTTFLIAALYIIIYLIKRNFPLKGVRRILFFFFNLMFTILGFIMIFREVLFLYYMFFP